MAGRSVRWIFAEGKTEAAAIPTRPVPAPSSRIWKGSESLVVLAIIPEEEEEEEEDPDDDDDDDDNNNGGFDFVSLGSRKGWRGGGGRR